MFVTSNNSQSGLNAIVALEPNDESPHSVWLYLSKDDEIISDCFLVNLVEPGDSVSKTKNRDAPPPVIRRYLTSILPSRLPAEDDLDFTWSDTGNGVAVSIDGSVIGFIVSDEDRGYSRALSRAGPWGNPWSEELFSSHFSG